MYVKTQNFSAHELEKFLEFQQRSFSILTAAAARLAGGETGKEVARQLVMDYYATGFKSFFHLPVILFGERAALPGHWTVGKFYPKKKTLEEGDSVILDAAHDGLWLVEPHAGKEGVGAKWEEILVIEDGKARWLDDNPPHVQQWRNIDAGRPYGPRA